MLRFKIWNLCLITEFIINQIIGEINLSSRPSWNQTGITIIGLSNYTNISSPYDISISYADILYISDTANDRIITIDLNDENNTSIIGSGPGSNLGEFTGPFGISTTNTSLYVIDFINSRVQKMLLNGSNPTRVPNINNFTRPHFIFVDNNDNIYLSDTFNHSVWLFLANGTDGILVAGDSTYGSNDNQLFFPNGIFVDSNGTLYIADHENHRIMKWFAGASSGIRVAGNGTRGKTLAQLNSPMQVIVDTNEYMYISDGRNSRVVRWPPNSTIGECIVGCTGRQGSSSTHLNFPDSIAFDSKGSLYVCDYVNNRIQKYQYQIPFYNQPELSSCATWSSTAITFADNNTIEADPYGLFIDITNTIYFPEKSLGRVQIWSEGSTTLTRYMSDDFNNSFSIFVTSIGDIYIDNGAANRRVDRWIENATESIPAMYVNGPCYSLFVDHNNSLYCSLGSLHRVIRRSMYDGVNKTVIIAGNGTALFAPNTLNSPRGIYVDRKFNLYVADCSNDRIQLFPYGQLNGTTIAGRGANNTIDLDCPIGIAFDNDGYLFISDSHNNRILGSNSDGFRCIVGCTNTSGLASNQLNHPRIISFDSYGNLFVVDSSNDRIQKFLLTRNTCNQSPSSPFFVTLLCPNSTNIGINCNTSSDPCTVLSPCQNNGTCTTINTTSFGYTCSCPSGFNGSQCQFNNRPCTSTTCWNNGICNETSPTTFHCSCATGWEGINCETKTDYCRGVSCQNNGVCRSAYLNYTCECLGQSYSGQFCQIASNKIKAQQGIAKSFASIAIAILICTAMFIIIMDILKYGFGLDFTGEELKNFRRKKKLKEPTCPCLRRPNMTVRMRPRAIKRRIPVIIVSVIRNIN
ncbi:hypothetical protein I4U23_011601 [Adineta vaga]|nr:hypothetical protein I4U23_011601 [Adineta vaga]